MNIKELVGAGQYEAVEKALANAFPDPGAKITPALVDATFQVAKHDWQAPGLKDLPIPPLASPLAAANAGAFKYYIANATHARKAAPHSSFTGELPVVRYRLPDKGKRVDAPTIHTPAGDLLPQDRLLTSVNTLWSRYRVDVALKFTRPARVEVIAPPRLNGARFAAISIYLCYAKEGDASPSFYILEAGLATGQPRMLYLGRTMDGTLMYQTQYRPSAFSREAHWYTAKLDMDQNHPDEPHRLTVKVFEQAPPTGQYLEVTVLYQRRAAPVLTHPFHLTAAAGARLQAIADALGVPSGLDQALFLKLVNAVAVNHLFTNSPRRS